MSETTATIGFEAAQWVVRAQDGQLRDADLEDLAVWLGRSERHVAAYDLALRIWGEVEDVDAAGLAPQSAHVINLPGRRPQSVLRPSNLVWASGAAACLALAVAAPLFFAKPVPAQLYDTAKGEHKTVTLADGTQLDLNTDTRIAVRFDGRSRHVTLDRGELALHVTHDANRPFDLTAGDVRITDLGTKFDVLREEGDVRVAVREGSVSLGPVAGAMNAVTFDAVTLGAGDVGAHANGAGTISLEQGQAESAFAWMTHHAVYRGLALGGVAKDLNRYFAKPIVVDPKVASLKISAILTLDTESNVVARLQAYAPVTVRTTGTAVYIEPQKN